MSVAEGRRGSQPYAQELWGGGGTHRFVTTGDPAVADSPAPPPKVRREEATLGEPAWL